LSQCDILIEFQPFYKTQYPSFLFCSPTYNGLGAALRDQKKLEQGYTNNVVKQGQTTSIAYNSLSD